MFGHDPGQKRWSNVVLRLLFWKASEGRPVSGGEHNSSGNLDSLLRNRRLRET